MMSSINAAQAVIGFLSCTLIAAGVAHAQTTYRVDDNGATGNARTSTAGAELVVNGGFDGGTGGWEQTGVSTGAGGWQSTPGSNGAPGWFWLNNIPGIEPEVWQLVGGLIPHETYIVSGYYKTNVWWTNGPSFQVFIDDDVFFEGGAAQVSAWTRFRFTFVAEDSHVMLRLRGQVGSDSDYGVDNISIVSSPSGLVLDGTFSAGIDGWTLSGIYPGLGGWWWAPGSDGAYGIFWLNGVAGQEPEVKQLVGGLTPNETYRVSGYYMSVVSWFAGPSFQVFIDDEVFFKGGTTRIDEWTYFSFAFIAEDSDALLTLRGQVGSDSDYGIDNIVVLPSPSGFVDNGTFREGPLGWEQSEVLPECGWQATPGRDGTPGYFWLNNVPGIEPEIRQSLYGLTPCETYVVSGYYRTEALWLDGPSFQVLIDDDVRFQGGATRVDEWTRFSFKFAGKKSRVLLTLRGQVGSDSDFSVDDIRVVPLRVVPYDIDEDGDVDPRDVTALPPCLSGPAAMHDRSGTCYELDSNIDGHVDLSDYAELQRCYSGSDSPPGSQCGVAPDVVEIAELLQIAGHLPLETGDLLAEFGFQASDISPAMRFVYDLDVNGIAQILTEFCGLAEQCTARILKDSGFSAVEIALALRDTFAQDARTALGVLNAVGIGQRQAENAMLEVFNSVIAIKKVHQLYGADYTIPRAEGWSPVNVERCTEPYLQGIVGSSDETPSVVAPASTWLTFWVEYVLVPIDSNTSVLVDFEDVGVFTLASAIYAPIKDSDSYIANLALTTEDRDSWADCTSGCYKPAAPPDLPEINSGDLDRRASWELGGYAYQTSVCAANGGFWTMKKLPASVGPFDESGNYFYYLWYGKAAKQSPLMPATVDSIPDSDKKAALKKYAPSVFFPTDIHFFPVSVDWHFDHTARAITPGVVCPYLWTYLAGSDDVRDFFYGEDSGTRPIYAFWLEKPITLGNGEVVEVVDLVYFTFYSWNQGKYIGQWYGNHVGDWEHVSIRLMWQYGGPTGDEWILQPTQVYVGAHDKNAILDWSTFPTHSGTHPIVYKAWGSHGFWPGPGTWEYKDVTMFNIPLEDECSSGELWASETTLHPYVFDPDAAALTDHVTNTRIYDCEVSLANPAGYSLNDYSWPLWLADCVCDNDYSLNGNQADPRDGPIDRWGNRRCMCTSWSDCSGCEAAPYDTLSGGPTGPAMKLWALRANPRLR